MKERLSNIAKTIQPAFGRWKYTPSAFGISPGGGDGPMDRDWVIVH